MPYTLHIRQTPHCFRAALDFPCRIVYVYSYKVIWGYCYGWLIFCVSFSRLTQLFEVYSVPGEGTVLLSQVWEKSAPVAPSTMEVGVINRPKPGQEVCGDSWAVEHLSGRSLYFLADGLGHGPDAAIASQDAVRAFRKNKARRPKEILELAHAAIHGTRGAAAAVAEIDFAKQEVCFAGIGNSPLILTGVQRQIRG